MSVFDWAMFYTGIVLSAGLILLTRWMKIEREYSLDQRVMIDDLKAEVRNLKARPVPPYAYVYAYPASAGSTFTRFPTVTPSYPTITYGNQKNQ